jgi:hypothetical protein
VVRFLLGYCAAAFRPGARLIENLCLWQQLLILQRKRYLNTVSGFTISGELRQPPNHRLAQIQNRRSPKGRRGGERSLQLIRQMTAENRLWDKRRSKRWQDWDLRFLPEPSPSA